MLTPGTGTFPQGAPRTRTSLLRLAGYLKPYWREQLGCLAFMGIGTAASLTIPLLVRQIFDAALPERDGAMLLRIVSAMAAIHAGYMLCMFATDVLFLRVSAGVVLTLRRRMHDCLLRLSTDHFDGTKSGQMTARVMGDVDAVQALTTSAFLMLVTDSFTILLMLGFMAAMSLPMTLIGAATLLLLLAIFRFHDRRLLAAARENRVRYGEVVEELQEGIAGIREIKAFTNEAARGESFARRLRAHARTSVRMGVLGSQSRLLGLFVVAVGPALIYLYGGRASIAGTMTIGTLVAFISYLTRMYEPAQRLSFLNVQLRTAVGAVERILAFLDLEPSVSESPTPVHPGRTRGEIVFESVRFRYGGNGGPLILEDVDIAIAPGEKVAIVGASGAGKSTVGHLICRLYDVEKGRILLDGHDLRDLSLDDLRLRIGVVPQETFLFHASVADNLRIANPDAGPEEIERAARLAQADEFIRELPRGYDTIVGERGACLSGGQRQRLSIARAILKDPPIVIFDEATSSLDAESEAHVKRSMDALMAGRTTIMISHRLSTVVDADRILVMERGRIVEEGTHSELIGQGGLYAELFGRQSPESTPSLQERGRNRPRTGAEVEGVTATPAASRIRSG